MADLRWLSGGDVAGWTELAALFDAFSREAIPAERPTTPDEWREGALDTVAHRRLWHVLAVEDGAAVGAAMMTVEEVRQESAWLGFLFVTPQYRRRGIGGCLLGALRERARAEGRSYLRATTIVGVADGARFAERAGGRAGLVHELVRCRTDRLDPDQLGEWCARAGERAAGYSLVAFDGVCPEIHLDAFVAAIPIMNTAPQGGAQEEFRPSREQVRAILQEIVGKRTSIWTVCARHDGTGDFVGYTQLFFPAHRPWLAAQGDTGVHPDHRRRGIGRWLKGHNALRLLAERPEVEFIETSNASSNDAMLSINRAMGFEVVARHQLWDVPV